MTNKSKIVVMISLGVNMRVAVKMTLFTRPPLEKRVIFSRSYTTTNYLSAGLNFYLLLFAETDSGDSSRFSNNRGSYYLSAGSQQNLSLAALFPLQGPASFTVCMYAPHGLLVYLPRPTLNRLPCAICTNWSTSVSDQFHIDLVYHVCFFFDKLRSLRHSTCELR